MRVWCQISLCEKKHEFRTHHNQFILSQPSWLITLLFLKCIRVVKVINIEKHELQLHVTSACHRHKQKLWPSWTSMNKTNQSHGEKWICTCTSSMKTHMHTHWAMVNILITGSSFLVLNELCCFQIINNKTQYNVKVARRLKVRLC